MRCAPSCSASSRARSRSRPSSALPDPAMNARLRAAIMAARAENMPKDNIERAIKKAHGRRRRELRGDPLRRLWPGRRRRDRRGADRQPQPHRRRGARDLHQERRQPRRDRRGLVHVRPCRRGRVRRQGGRAPTPCWRPRSRPAPTTWRRARPATKSTPRRDRCAEVAKALEAQLRRAAQVGAGVEAAEPRSRSTTSTGEKLLQADRDAQRPRRRAERLRQFRSLRRADGPDGGIGASAVMAARRADPHLERLRRHSGAALRLRRPRNDGASCRPNHSETT